MNTPMLMGRKTWDSLPKKPLPGRTNIVITRDPAFAASGALVASSLDAALDAARGDALRRGADTITVIGGSEIFALTLPRADRIEFTRVHLNPDGDTLFPPLDLRAWDEVSRSDHKAGPNDDADFSILRYERREAG